MATPARWTDAPRGLASPTGLPTARLRAAIRPWPRRAMQRRNGHLRLAWSRNSRLCDPAVRHRCPADRRYYRDVHLGSGAHDLPRRRVGHDVRRRALLGWAEYRVRDTRSGSRTDRPRRARRADVVGTDVFGLRGVGTDVFGLRGVDPTLLLVMRSGYGESRFWIFFRDGVLPRGTVGRAARLHVPDHTRPLQVSHSAAARMPWSLKRGADRSVVASTSEGQAPCRLECCRTSFWQRIV
jgi:hypothetical protein